MIEVPDKVKVAIAGDHVAVEGPKGKLEMDMPAARASRRRETS